MRESKSVSDHGLAYRPDLDGLRGIAVAAVTAYHLNAHWAPGGFVGVDVFFVLSGFLIARLIAADLEAGRFTLIGFYERRIRRIVPALVFVLACCTVVALFVLLPNELENYASSLRAAALSISNFWLLNHAGYFDPAAGEQPLLHTWSLGVEEQFYLLFPLILASAFRWIRPWVGALIWILLALSLALNVALMPNYDKTAFYLIFSRAWELLIGSILGLGFVPEARSSLQREMGGVLGLLAIAVAVYAYDSTTPFPGVAAVLPCIGAALVIWAGQGSTLVARLLSVRPLVFLGLISYSLYLWHWPLIAFIRVSTNAVLSPAMQVAVACASLLLATLTWWFVEKPFRRRGASGLSARTIFWSGGLGIGLLTACGLGIVMLHGMPQRYSKEVLDLADGARDRSPLRRKCHSDGNRIGTYDKTCVIGAAVPPKIIVYGDSHGAELSAVLGALAEPRNASVREITSSACPPALGYATPDRPRCAEYNAAMVKSLSSLPPATIIVTANAADWPLESGDPRWPGFKATVAALKSAGHRVIIYGPAPNHTHGVPVPAKLARWAKSGLDPKDYDFDPGMSQFLGVEARMREIASDEHATYVPLAQAYCSELRCKPYLDGTVLYLDDNHLSMSGAKLLATKLLVPVLWPEIVALPQTAGATLPLAPSP
jgi:peptidoglycan/LPS O-acetylase OafA/YrhL